MVIPKRNLQKCLRKKFGFVDVGGSKHDALALFYEDRKVATVRFSFGQREIDDTILKLIAKEAWVQLGFLKGMYSCKKSEQDYIKFLDENNLLRP